MAIQDRGSDRVHDKEVAREAQHAPAVGSKRRPDRQWEEDRNKRARVPEKEVTPEAMAGGTYFSTLLDEIATLQGSTARSLDHEVMTETTLYNYIACHNFLVSFVFIS